MHGTTSDGGPRFGEVANGELSPLAGCGIWYGRVGPEHVEGLVGETLGRGSVIGDLLRGGIMRDGGVLSREVEGQMRGDVKGERKEAMVRPRPRR